ncbi:MULTISPECIES: sulfurtransferase [Nocardia]|uniref:Sulfurtransferase n=2 Tax=Nocardia TaxID=1817 RepID=A0A2T2Z1H4_9NOCA|nr:MULTISPECIES: sulfurtransferase [Nocardia]MBF6447112.1 sulfurtransferase [Nocardia elegans]PSR61585.1 sulfurtransferase [Nocardia nova]
MPVAPDSHPSFGSHAYPQRLVTTEWLSANIGTPGLAIVESNEDILLYDIGHVPGAVKIDWRAELTDPLTRDVIDGARFAELMRAKGIAREDTVVVYGDKANGTAAATAWVFGLFGHPDVRLLDGGRDAWISEARDTTFEVPDVGLGEYPVVERDDRSARAFLDDVRACLNDGGTGAGLVDVRAAGEYTGDDDRIRDRPEEQSLRAGHIPTAINIPWTAAVGGDGRFRSRSELEEIYAPLLGAEDTIVYCRIGEHSAHTWFVLTSLLGVANVRNYDGSWTEWSNAVRTPIVKGSEPGSAPVAVSAAAQSV